MLSPSERYLLRKKNQLLQERCVCSIYSYPKTHRVYFLIVIVGAIALLSVPYNMHEPKKLPEIMQQDIIDAMIMRYAQNPKLVKAIIRIESNYRVRAVSNKGAQGLMQVMPFWVKHLDYLDSTDDLFNVELNIRAGCDILHKYQRESKSLREALIKYSCNANQYYEKVQCEMAKQKG